MSSTGAGCFESKTLSRSEEVIQALDHQPTGRSGAAFGIEGREAASDFIHVHELADVERRRQPSYGPSRLAGAVGPADDNDIFHRFGAHGPLTPRDRRPPRRGSGTRPASPAASRPPWSRPRLP